MAPRNNPGLFQQANPVENNHTANPTRQEIQTSLAAFGLMMFGCAGITKTILYCTGNSILTDREPINIVSNIAYVALILAAIPAGFDLAKWIMATVKEVTQEHGGAELENTVTQHRPY